MISRIVTVLLLTASAFFCAVSTGHADAASNRANKIKVLTKQLKMLPNGGTSAATITSLVKKLVKLQPDKTSQYYALGLRKSNVPNAAGIAYSKKLNDDIQKLVDRSNLSAADMADQMRRLNKIQRLYMPPAPEPAPTPAPYSA